jgi:hypothetical protein
MKKLGRPPNPNTPRRVALCEKFGVAMTNRRMKINLSIAFMDRLDACKDDEARRILLGVSR